MNEAKKRKQMYGKHARIPVWVKPLAFDGLARASHLPEKVDSKDSKSLKTVA